jgi:hypothetical protein
VVTEITASQYCGRNCRRVPQFKAISLSYELQTVSISFIHERMEGNDFILYYI